MTIPTWDELNGNEPPDEPPDEREPTHAEIIKSRLLTTADLKNIPRPTPLLDGLLYMDSLAMLYGPSGGGKSFVAVDIAMTVGSTKQWWNSCAVSNGLVLYVVAEGASGISMRTEAWEKRHEDDANVLWHPQAINVFEPLWASALAQVVAELRPVLVIIDTYARSTLGLEENATKDTGIVVAHLDMIRTAAGCCVLVVHHSGKNIEAGARGNSALKGAMDTEIELLGDDARMALRNTKQKNAPEMLPLWLKLDGEAESAVVIPALGDGDTVSETTLESLEALSKIEVPGGVSTSAWKAAAGFPDRTFYRHRKTLLDHKLVKNLGSEKQPKYVVNHDQDMQ
jgi:hypothetical protein